MWSELFDAATAVLNKRTISEYVDAGGVAAAVESTSGRVYVGVCVDSACSLGICAERNAIFNMITNGEDKLIRVLAINSDRKAVPPCGACRELIAQIMPESYKDVEIMLDYEKNKTTTLGELTPQWWI